MSPLPPRRVDGRAGHRTSQSLPELPVEPAPRQHARRPRRGLLRLDGADRDLRAGRRRVVARAPLRDVRHHARQPHRGRRQPARADAPGRQAARAAAVPARMAVPDVTWLGVDVGGPRKGVDVALIDAREVLELRARLSAGDVVALVESARPAVVGIDSPRSCAPDGATSRASERALARAVCGIRWTPDRARVEAGGYYRMVRAGPRP